MDGLLEFARGPLFRLCFALMILGLARVFVLDIWSMIEAYGKAGDKNIPWRLMIGRTVEWLIPVRRIFNNRPIYSVLSIIFHIGLIIVPIFLYAHVVLWKEELGIAWPTLPYNWAYVLTISTIVTALALFVGRLLSNSSSFLSRKQDYLWPLILLIPFVTGFICADMNVSAKQYRFFMLVHVLSGNLIFVLIPFSKIAHCILMPLSQAICILAWKFPPETDEEVSTTLNKKGAPV